MKTLTAVVAATLALSGCATSSGVELTLPPEGPSIRFTAVEVAPIALSGDGGAAGADLGAGIRRGIIHEVTGSGDFALVVSELEPAPGAVLISCAILDFKEGSKLSRFLVGFGAGKAELRLSCGFTDRTNGETYAEGVFQGELEGGFLGGDADGETMGKEVGKAIGRFLRGEPGK